MTTSNNSPDASKVPTAYGWCSWHGGNASGIRLINSQEQGSGPGGGAFACEPCREKHGLIPFSERPL